MTAEMRETPPDLEAAARRSAALEVSGWGQPFHLLQPRNLCLWVWGVFVVVGLVHMVQMLAPLSGYYSQAFSAALVIAVVSTLVWGWWFHHLDRFERQPFSLVVLCFVWGGLAATFAIGVNANGALGSLYTKLFGAVWSANWQAGLSAPFVEESAKAAGFVLALGLARHLVRTPADGVLLGAFIGLGFQTFEDFLYAIISATGSFGSDQLGAVTGGIATRILSDVVSHPMFSALVCAGLVYLLGTPAQPRRVGRGLLLVGSGVGIHLVWDSMLAISRGNSYASFAVMVTTMVASLGILWWAFRASDGRERELARDILAPEAETGVLTPVELDALTTRDARKAYLKGAGSRKQRRARRHVLTAAIELCADLASSQGEDSEDVRHGRAEVVRLRERAGAVPA
ncbi:PrsW family intramembrane metalloprotease [Aeromicrobium massiliense]|uniref:PrsW family intramembrane metalloprotease n=1 Tax=Aeromicrobium massiliense TaxID=1464554 RepID=UPI0002ED7D8E|nr:PrsW family intramembrane metalloprotease [Aeromicrobium massiliense]